MLRLQRSVIWPTMILLGWTETKLWTLKYGSKSIQTSLILRQRPPKPCKLVIFISFVTTVKARHAPTIWKKLRWKSLCLPSLNSLKSIAEMIKLIRDVFTDFEPNFKVHSLVSVDPKSIILTQMTNLDMIFHVVVSVYRLVKIWNSLQFPAEFRNAGPIPSRTSHPASGFPALFHNTDSPLFGDPQFFFTWRGRCKKFQYFCSQRQKSSLVSRCNVKGKISGGIKGFSGLMKASILSTKYC